MKVDEASLLQQIQDIRADANALLADLSETQFNWRSEPQVWSIAQCLDHLNLFARTYFPVISQLIIIHANAAALPDTAAPPSYTLNLLNKLVVRQIEPPVRIKASAPESLQPTPDKSLWDVQQGFHTAQEALIQIIQRAKNVAWDKVKVPSPQTNHLKFSLATTFAVVVAHERRHLWQAWHVRQYTKFPDK